MDEKNRLTSGTYLLRIYIPGHTSQRGYYVNTNGSIACICFAAVSAALLLAVCGSIAPSKFSNGCAADAIRLGLKRAAACAMESATHRP